MIYCMVKFFQRNVVCMPILCVLTRGACVCMCVFRRRKEKRELSRVWRERDGRFTGSIGFHPQVHGADARDVLHRRCISSGDILPHHKHACTTADEGAARCPPATATCSARGGELGGIGGLRWFWSAEATSYGHQSSDLRRFPVQVLFCLLSLAFISFLFLEHHHLCACISVWFIQSFAQLCQLENDS